MNLLAAFAGSTSEYGAAPTPELRQNNPLSRGAKTSKISTNVKHVVKV
jgi:hypothetical protein